MPEPAQTASCPKQLLQRRTADRDAAEDTRPRGKPAVWKDPLQNPQPPRGTALQTPSTMPPRRQRGTARNRQHDQKTRQTSRADERDQQRQPSCLRSDRAGHSCTQQTPSRWRCDGLCSCPLDIENAVLEKSVSAMKGDCQREARML